jgi:hypothetical protein
MREESLCATCVRFLEILLRVFHRFFVTRLDHLKFGYSNLFRISDFVLRIWLRPRVLCGAVKANSFMSFLVIGHFLEGGTYVERKGY